MRTNQLTAARAAALAISFAAATRMAAAANPCPPDTNCSGTVDVTDLLGVVANWGTSGGPSDINGSGTVDVTDLLAVVASWGPCVFQFPSYPNSEAHQIGLEMLGANGPLALSQALYERIDRDLGLIRAAYPALATQIHSDAWVPNQMLVSIDPGSMTEYNCYNAYYGLTNSEPLFSNWHTLTFAGSYNVPALAELYMGLSAVGFAEPNGMIGGQNFWRPEILFNGVWRWTVDDAWHDCFDGCDCHRVYTLDIDANGAITQISIEEWGMRWCDFN